LLEIDGAYGEGGGQVLRNSAALSCVNNKSIKITNIRANREQPGLKPQHYVVLKSLKEIFGAETTGVEIGSTEVTFKPGKIKPDKYKFEVGTAGSITLVFQAIILACLNAKEQITVSISGGTDVKWSPSWDYFENVFLPLIERMGVKIYSDLILRGYYPRGGGEAVITINPTKKLKPLNISNEIDFSEVKGTICISNLSEDIARRIKHTATKTFLKEDFLSKIDVQQSTSLSPGVGVTLWSGVNNAIIGSTVLGDKGIPSEEVGLNVANYLLEEIKSYSTVDIHAFDQILPYMVLASKNGVSCCNVRKLSNHASTNMWLLKQFYPKVDFEALQNEDNFQIKVK